MLEFLDYVYIFILIIVVVVLKDLFVYVFFKQDNKKIERLVNHRPRKSKNVLEEFFSTSDNSDNQANCDKIQRLLSNINFDRNGSLQFDCNIKIKTDKKLETNKITTYDEHEGLAIMTKNKDNYAINLNDTLFVREKDADNSVIINGDASRLSVGNLSCKTIKYFRSTNDGTRNYINVDTNLDLGWNTVTAYNIHCKDIWPMMMYTSDGEAHIHDNHIFVKGCIYNNHNSENNENFDSNRGSVFELNDNDDDSLFRNQDSEREIRPVSIHSDLCSPLPNFEDIISPNIPRSSFQF